MISLSIVTLTKSCLRAVDCTYDDDRGISTLDVMPDVVCVDRMGVITDPFGQQAAWALALMVIYVLVVPAMICAALHLAKQTERIGERGFQQRYGWFLLKYRPVSRMLLSIQLRREVRFGALFAG